jgi:hypothetical protein
MFSRQTVYAVPGISSYRIFHGFGVVDLRVMLFLLFVLSNLVKVVF